MIHARLTDYEQRQRELLFQISDGVAIIPTSPENERIPYHTDKNFFYLTGLAEPDMVLVLVAGNTTKTILFCKEPDPETTIWTGERFGTERTKRELGFSEAYPLESLDEVILKILPGTERVYYPMARNDDFSWDERILGWVKKSRKRNTPSQPEICDVSPLIAEQRLVKSESEIEVMRRAAKISAEAHIEVMKKCKPGMKECELEAVFSAYCRARGCSALHAYPPIVAGGKNACVLHYTKNRDCLYHGDLLLLDAGAELEQYAADITRTFPVNGKFTGPQHELYQLTLEAQKAGINEVRPGNTYLEPHVAAVRILAQGLVDLDLLGGDVDGLVEEKLAKWDQGRLARFFPHRTGHYLGLNVHDVGDYNINGEWHLLEPGMVLTVEPGLYIPAGMEGVPEKYWNIGIRIEDDVLVTKDGCEVLSAAVPKEIDEIENLMRG